MDDVTKDATWCINLSSMKIDGRFVSSDVQNAREENQPDEYGIHANFLLDRSKNTQVYLFFQIYLLRYVVLTAAETMSSFVGKAMRSRFRA